MSWYYSNGEEQRGPVGQAAFDRLVAERVIGPATLVWKEGMADWAAWGQLGGAAPPFIGVTGATGATELGAPCSVCGKTFASPQLVRVGGKLVCANCKPAVMQRMREGVADSNAELIRREHLNHEASIKAVGFLYLLPGAVVVLLDLLSLTLGGAVGTGMPVGLFLVLLFIGGISLVVGLGLRRLRRWVRIPAVILSVVGLLIFPIGTLINAYVLYLLLSGRGAMVFSDEYAQIMADTPHIKYRTPVVAWILLALLLLTLLIIVAAVVTLG